MTRQQRRGDGGRRAAEFGAVGLLIPGLGVAWARVRLADALTDRHARRPAGGFARRFYGKRRSYHGLGEALEATRLEPEDRLVEVGCGGGLLLELALQACRSAKAIDHSPDMLRLAAARNAQALEEGRLELVAGDAQRMPFAGNEFSAAVMVDVLLVLERPQAVLVELHRVLAEHGRVVIHTRAPETIPLMRWIGLGWMARRLRFYSDQSLAEMLTAAGFADVVIERRVRGSAQLVTARRP